MTKEYEDKKKERPLSPLFKAFEVVIKVAVIIVALLFLLMVIFPKGLWVDLF